ncbi:hypothetical protein C8Z91_34815 [Paenibacillus elgii]|uniref:Glycosyltransferase n=1 Tax=Paenibacillus elgii TaxID=189691 RepID=A0A2T6FRV8_9BACL|nr:glycosyltransferase family 4 protein [Paenibacillus elgii]PUA34640.1 hypothetical protein C8Z91_34815 [Paenibacillus elgii]
MNKEENEIIKAREGIKKALTVCDGVICFTKEDMESMVQLGADKRKVFLLPCGTNPGKINNVGAKALNKHNMLFLGNLFHEPNRIALKDIRKIILPRVRKRFPDARLILVGDAPRELVKEIMCDESISYKGTVEDLNEVFKETSIALCPITSGSGMRIKVLDYLTAGLPIVTTEMGVKDAITNKGVIFENDVQKFAEHIINIFNSDISDVQRECNLARQIAEGLAWEKIAEDSITIYKSMLNGSRVIDNVLFNFEGKILSEPYFLQDFIKLNRFDNHRPTFKDFGYGVLQNGEMVLK